MRRRRQQSPCPLSTPRPALPDEPDHVAESERKRSGDSPKSDSRFLTERCRPKAAARRPDAMTKVAPNDECALGSSVGRKVLMVISCGKAVAPR